MPVLLVEISVHILSSLREWSLGDQLVKITGSVINCVAFYVRVYVRVYVKESFLRLVKINGRAEYLVSFYHFCRSTFSLCGLTMDRHSRDCIILLGSNMLHIGKWTTLPRQLAPQKHGVQPRIQHIQPLVCHPQSRMKPLVRHPHSSCNVNPFLAMLAVIGLCICPGQR